MVPPAQTGTPGNEFERDGPPAPSVYSQQHQAEKAREAETEKQGWYAACLRASVSCITVVQD